MYDLETIKAMETRTKQKDQEDQLKDRILDQYRGQGHYIGPVAMITRIRSNNGQKVA